jgi:alpha-mannosidase
VIHKNRWTVQKIEQRLTLIEPLVYRRRHPLSPFKYAELSSPLDAPLIGSDVNDSDWPAIAPDTYWGKWQTNFTLRGHFQIPANWNRKSNIALYLPLGDAGDFIHPEALIYVDGVSYTLSTGFALAAAWHTNLLEQNEQTIAVDGQQITFSLHPYEIVTLRLIPA